MIRILCLALLPCLWAAEVQKIVCPDGKECPIGQTCCGLPNGVFQCCDLPEEVRLNKKLIPAKFSHSTSNVSNAHPDGPESAMDFCPTHCGAYCCICSSGTCCNNPKYCCLSGTRCCSNSYNEQPWCCLNKYRCYTSYGYCLGGAATVSLTILSLLPALVLAVMSKNFL